MAVTPLRNYFSGIRDLPSVDAQRQVALTFLQELAKTSLLPWGKGQAVPQAGSFLLVGVSVGWNLYDRELIAALDEAAAEGARKSDVIAVFLADLLSTASEVDELVPELEQPLQTPFIGWWQDGTLRYSGAGPTAASFLCDRYGLVLP